MFGLAKKPFLALRIYGTKAGYVSRIATDCPKLVLSWGMDYQVMKIYTIEVVHCLFSGVRDQVTTELMMEPCSVVQLENCFWCMDRVIGIKQFRYSLRFPVALEPWH